MSTFEQKTSTTSPTSRFSRACIVTADSRPENDDAFANLFWSYLDCSLSEQSPCKPRFCANGRTKFSSWLRMKSPQSTFLVFERWIVPCFCHRHHLGNFMSWLSLKVMMIVNWPVVSRSCFPKTMTPWRPIHFSALEYSQPTFSLSFRTLSEIFSWKLSRLSIATDKFTVYSSIVIITRQIHLVQVIRYARNFLLQSRYFYLRWKSG